MGRGRQKAKQTKVARELKYSSYEPNYRALEQELASGGGRRSDLATDTREPADDEVDPYGTWPDDR
ncbi:DUF3073 domain-containing protein [Cellulomonas sp. APG4]|uniref:DUF3073 domain-containing protein n=1 Tax=Cellulomonas sp. APG4 TaxID=1538656 RepID=UPI001379D8C1|nr:DUF3073 domain-containing protein [Cellulomonas sp. APG4]NCT90290.1 DUF3073 domain-containing protein [Cellulomonas sp. APG4]